MPLIPINDLGDPRLEIYRQLKKTNLTRWSGQFIAEGRKLTIQLLQSDFPVHSVLVSEKHVDKIRPHLHELTPAYVLPHQLAGMLVGFDFHSGMMGCGVRRPAPDLDSLIDQSKRNFFVVCPLINNPDNMGTVVRIAAGFGVTAVLLGSGCCDPFSRRALRVSMGNAYRMPILEAGESLPDVVEHLRKQHDVELIATVLDRNAEPLKTARSARNCALVMGNEDSGLTPEWIERCDRRVTIPMHERTDSLNVAVATGIFLHHFAEP